MEHRDRLRGLLLAAVGGLLWVAPGLALAQSGAEAATEAPEAAAAEPTLQQRLERMVTLLEEAREDMHVPGMAIAVVKDDQVILARGFGVADLETQEPATEHTLFAVGSTTKAFTATLAGMLVDEGKMSWDDPVRQHLPEFSLTDPQADEQVVIRDLLCHRVGLASMTLLWYGNTVSSQEVLETACSAELLYPFREKWNYSNICFLAAGEAAARTAGTDWHAMVAGRIFEPLGMADTNTTLEAAVAHPRLAKGYRWDDDEDDWVHQPMRSIHAVAPAGAINSSVVDMAQWVRFQLARGEFEGRRLLSEAQHQETWTSHMEVGDGMEYGLGWFLREWRGRPGVDHAGGIDGFTAEVAMLPEENLGFVLLMNLFGSPLQEASREIVFYSLLGEWDDDEPSSTEDFTPYLGSYIANFGPFKDAEMKVLVQNERLAVDVPGQMIFEMNPPDDEGKRPFVITDQIAVRFNEGDDGEIQSLTLFQAGFEFEAPREGVEFPLEIDMDVAGRYLGGYHFEPLGQDVTVQMQNNRLALDVPWEMVYELHPPDDEGRWVFRVKDTLWVRFNETESGEVVSITLVNGEKEDELVRLARTDAPALPTVDELMALMRDAGTIGDLAGIDSIRAAGTMHLVHMGVHGTNQYVATADGRLHNVFDFGQFGRIVTGVAGENGWIDAMYFEDDEIGGEMLEQMRLDSPFLWHRDWRESFKSVAVVGRTTVDDQPVLEIRLTPHEGQPLTTMVNAETGLPVSRHIPTLSPMGMRVDVDITLHDFRQVGDLLLPSRVEISNDLSGRAVITYETFETNVEVDEGIFEGP